MVTLYKFTAPWCPSCPAFSKIVDKVVSDIENIEVVEVDMMKNDFADIKSQFNISTLPALGLNGHLRIGSGLESAVRDWILARL